MRKILVVVFSLVFAGFVFASDVSLDGGPARLMAMGGQEIIVPDASSTADLYEAGFTSAIFTRPAITTVNIYPELELYGSKRVNADTAQHTIEDSYFGFGNGVYRQKNSGISIWFGDDAALVIKPYLQYMPGTSKTREPGTPGYTGTTDNTSLYTLAGEIEFAKKISETFSLGLLAGYSREGMNAKNENRESWSYVDKLDYMVSASLLPAEENGWIFSLAAGNRTNPLSSGFAETDALVDEFGMMMSVYSGFFSTHSHSKYESPTLRQEYNNSGETSGLVIDFGAGTGSGKNVFSAKAGLITAMSITNKSKEVDTMLPGGTPATVSDTTNKPVKSSLGGQADIKTRMDMGGTLLGFRILAQDLGLDVDGSSGAGKMNILNTKLSAGVSFLDSDTFSLPLEIFQEKTVMDQNTGSGYESINEFMDLGLKLGVEIGISKDMSLRFGTDFTYAGSTTTHRQDGTDTEQDAGIGSKNNPALVQVGINAGIGFKGESMETNIGLRFEPQMTMPKDDNYKEQSWSFVRLGADIKILMD